MLTRVTERLLHSAVESGGGRHTEGVGLARAVTDDNSAQRSVGLKERLHIVVKPHRGLIGSVRSGTEGRDRSARVHQTRSRKTARRADPLSRRGDVAILKQSLDCVQLNHETAQTVSEHIVQVSSQRNTLKVGSCCFFLLTDSPVLRFNLAAHPAKKTTKRRGAENAETDDNGVERPSPTQENPCSHGDR